MINKKFIILLLPFLLTSCDYFGSTKTKNLIDLTKQLDVEDKRTINLVSSHQNIELDYTKKVTSYKLNKGNLITAPAIAKSMVYSLDDKGYISAFSLKTGKFLWSSKFIEDGDTHISGSILYSDGKLYVATGSRDLIIIDATNGVPILTKSFPDILHKKPVMVNDRLLVVQTVSNQLVGFDTVDAKILWINEGNIEIINSKNHTNPVSVNGNVLASYSSGEIVLVDPKTGKNKWMISLSDEKSINSYGFDLASVTTKPIMYNNHLYFATSNGLLMKVNAATGNIIWKKDIEDVQSMTLSGSNLIITTNARQAAIISTKNGLINWTGELITKAEKLKTKQRPVVFQSAFVVNDIHNKQVLNFIASNGELYQFAVSNGMISSTAKVISIPKGVINYWISCCNNKVHLFTNKYANF